MITLYVYRISDGVFLYEDTGKEDFVIHDIGSDKSFTMQPIPNHDNQWRWAVDKWVMIEPEVLPPPTQEEVMPLPAMSELMGSPPLSYAKLETTANAGQDTVNMAHGLDASSILNVAVSLKDDGGTQHYVSERLAISTNMESIIISGISGLGVAGTISITALITYEVK